MKKFNKILKNYSIKFNMEDETSSQPKKETNGIFKSLYEGYSKQYLVEKNYYYKVPKDKEQLMNDFYLIDLMRGYPWNKIGDTDIGKTASESTVYSLMEAKDIILKTLKEEFLESVFFSLAAEFRHIYAMNGSKTLRRFFKDYDFGKDGNGLDFLKDYTADRYMQQNMPDFASRDKRGKSQRYEDRGDSQNYIASYKALNGTKVPRKYIVQMMEDAYRNLEWEEHYGGEAWADIAAGWTRLYNATTENELFPAIDRIYDLQHNTSTVFDKTKKYYKRDAGGYDWILKALDRKFAAMSPWELWKHSSGSLKSMFAELIKAAGWGTLEDFIKNVEKEGYKDLEQMDRLKLGYKQDFRHPSDENNKKQPKQSHGAYVTDVRNRLKYIEKRKKEYDEFGSGDIYYDYNYLNDIDIRSFIKYVPLELRSEYEDTVEEIHKIYRKKYKEEEVENKIKQRKGSDGTWTGGTWYEEMGKFDAGTWKGGTWKGGTFINGVWEDGEFENGSFEWSEFRTGNIHGGTFRNSVISNAEIKSAQFYICKIYDVLIKQGIFYKSRITGHTEVLMGSFTDSYLDIVSANNIDITRSTWKGGNWKGGKFYSGTWEDGTWEDGIWYGRVQDWKGGIWVKGKIWIRYNTNMDVEYVPGPQHTHGVLVESTLSPPEYYKKLNELPGAFHPKQL
jgi:hypothetical protein